VGGPKQDYQQPEIDAMKRFVEDGGRAIFMLDPPISSGAWSSTTNQALVNVLSSWGVTPEKDLVLDTSGVGQIFGLGPEYALVGNYESHAIVREMKEVATGFPIARSLQVKNGEKSTAEKLFSTSEEAFATTNLSSPEIKPGKNDKRVHWCWVRRALTRSARKAATGVSWWWGRPVGSQIRSCVSAESRPVPEHDELAVVG